MANTKILNIGCTTQALYNQGPRALSLTGHQALGLTGHQALGLTGPWIWDTIGLMQACSAAQCEQSGSGINTIINPELQVWPGIPSSLISSKASVTHSLKRQATVLKLRATGIKPNS